MTAPVPHRRRLPNRRPSLKQSLEVGGQVVTVDIGFDPTTGQPRELFLTAGREGSLLNALLADAAVTISVGLQCGVPVTALAKSVGRLPKVPMAPDDLGRPSGRVPASPIGAALDLLCEMEAGPARPHDNGPSLATERASERT